MHMPIWYDKGCLWDRRMYWGHTFPKLRQFHSKKMSIAWFSDPTCIGWHIHVLGYLFGSSWWWSCICRLISPSLKMCSWKALQSFLPIFICTVQRSDKNAGVSSLWKIGNPQTRTCMLDERHGPSSRKDCTWESLMLRGEGYQLAKCNASFWTRETCYTYVNHYCTPCIAPLRIIYALSWATTRVSQTQWYDAKEVSAHYSYISGSKSKILIFSPSRHEAHTK